MPLYPERAEGIGLAQGTRIVLLYSTNVLRVEPRGTAAVFRRFPNFDITRCCRKSYDRLETRPIRTNRRSRARRHGGCLSCLSIEHGSVRGCEGHLSIDCRRRQDAGTLSTRSTAGRAPGTSAYSASIRLRRQP